MRRFSLCWLVDMVYSVSYLWVLGEGAVWFCCWLDELRRNSFSATQKKVYRVGLFLCWLVDMVYSVLYLWVLREGVVWFYCWLVELSKTLASATQKKWNIGCFFSVDLLICHILSCFYESWEKGWCDFAVDLLNWEAEKYFHPLKKIVWRVFFLCWLVDMV